MPVFLKRFPLVRVELWVLNRPVDPVEEGVDIALRVRAVIEDSATLAARNFGESRGMLVASPELLQRHPPIRTVQDLRQLDTVSMSSHGGSIQWKLFGPDGATHKHEHEPRYVADDLLTLRFAVLQGIGASVLPDYMCRDDVKAGRLVKVLPDWGPAAAITHAMYPPRRALVPAVRQLIDFLAENLDGDEPHDFVI
jgi:DNA-binding transcriptional LysR family regulator